MKESIRSGDDVKATLHTEALKLANELNTNPDIDATIDWAYKAQDMIRKLVNRIAELEKENKELSATVDWFAEKQTKQCKDCGEINPAEIHTCSPQTKLSDDEALKLVSEKLHYSEYKQGLKLVRNIEEHHGIKFTEQESLPKNDAKEDAITRTVKSCNGFCGEYECKENQANCNRIKK